MEALGIDSAAAGQQVAWGLLGTVIIFFVISPIGGYFLHKFIKGKTPDTGTFALIAGAFILFIVTFGLTLAIILQLTEQSESTFVAALLISTLVGIVLTAASTVFVVRIIERGKKKINAEDLTFSVWEEDKKNKPKNLRQRR